MRFMMLMYPQAPAGDDGAMPAPEAIAAMMKYNEDLAKAGVLLALDGLHPTSKGTRIRFADGKRTVSDGPFAEAKEIVGGYWLLQVKSKAEAVEWASRCPAESGSMLELRQVVEMSDFGPEIERHEAAAVAEIGRRIEENKQRTTP